MGVKPACSKINLLVVGELPSGYELLQILAVYLFLVFGGC